MSLATPGAILNALARTGERLVDRMDTRPRRHPRITWRITCSPYRRRIVANLLEQFWTETWARTRRPVAATKR
jgi:hypothetical protein